MDELLMNQLNENLDKIEKTLITACFINNPNAIGNLSEARKYLIAAKKLLAIFGSGSYYVTEYLGIASAYLELALKDVKEQLSTMAN